MRPRWFAHVDMDAFYASVEILDRPELRGLPVAVGGRADARGVIAAASYAARRFGVRSAMPTAEAQRRCPELVLLPGRMERYAEKSREVMEILRSVAPAVEPLSLDEAALDLTGCARVHHAFAPSARGGAREDWTAFALGLRMRIRRETGLWASIGMGETRRIAKIASDLRKPRGLVIVERGAGVSFLGALPVERLWGVGPRLAERLREAGLPTAADIARCSRPELQSRLGKIGPHLHDIVHARETGEVHPERAHKSISHEITFALDRTGSFELEPVLQRLSEKVGARLRRQGVVGRVVQLKVRDRGFHTFTRRLTLPRPTDSDQTIYISACRLLRALAWEQVPVRLIGVGVCDLTTSSAVQGDLFATAQQQSRPRLERVLDSVHDRFGDTAIGHGSGLLDPLRARDGRAWIGDAAPRSGAATSQRVGPDSPGPSSASPRDQRND